MRLYNLVSGMNPDSGTLLAMVGPKMEHGPRLSDVFIE